MPYTVGLWVPTRARVSPISIEHPGMWMDSLKAEFLSALTRDPECDVIDGLDFRQAHIVNGDVYSGDHNFADVDVFFWFGELDRGRASYDIDILEAIGLKTTVVNRAQPLRIALDKLLTQLHLRRHGIPVPEFYAFSRANVEQLRKVIDGRSFILKPRFGSFGVGITRVQDFDQLVDMIDYSEQTAHFLEELIDTSPEDFIGINVIGEDIVSSYGKQPSCFRSWKVFDRNRCGGGMVPREPSPEQRRIALEVARVVGLDVLGVDIIRSRQGQNYVIDVNSFPGLYPTLNAHFECDVPQLCADLVRTLRRSRAASQVS